MTNLDRLRRMSADEIAVMLTFSTETDDPPYFIWNFNKFAASISNNFLEYEDAIEACIDWLNNEEN